MSTQIVDSENVINSLEEAPDRLRAEIGQYYLLTDQGFQSETFSSGKIKTATIEHQPPNDQVLIPIKKATILIEGEEHVFRDHVQWNEYISQTIAENRQFLDHTFSFTQPSVTNQFIKNFHHPEYEDSTKAFASNQLLNYNLISYPYESEKVRDIGYLRTEFDQIPTDQIDVSTLMQQFPNRIANYTGSATEILTKQRNIFDLDYQINNKRPDRFPFFFNSHKSEIVQSYSGFSNLLISHKKLKNLFQSIKKDLSFSLRGFNVGSNQTQAKVYNAISLLTSTSLVRFSESMDELFLLPESETNHSDPSERFMNQIDAVRFLSEMRRQVDEESRNIEEVYNNVNCESFLLGYKIEKYLDNDATQPIQTYYTTENNLIDTQLKYGRRYIYKTKVLVGIFGSSYSYSNLQVAQSEIDEGAPTPEKYWATVDVEVQPSFQILEYEIDVHETALVDTPMLTPHVTTYGRKDKPIVNFLFQPRFFTMGEFGQQDLPPVGNLRPSDERIADLYNLVGDLRLAPDYFTGIYEIYRLDKPPEKKEDFRDGFLTTVDESVDSGNLDATGHPIKTIDVDYARFTDFLIPNRKYYYAFRTLTYHGTPSQLTDPVEIELQQDSDKYKIVVKHYHYPMHKDYSYQKKAKRLIRILPNIERLLFSKEEDSNNWELDDGNLVNFSESPRTFKIRVTSKHTGKKMDLNVTFRLRKDGSFFLPIVGPN